jgi:hypothetical protein
MADPRIFLSALFELARIHTNSLLLQILFVLYKMELLIRMYSEIVNKFLQFNEIFVFA